MIMGSNQRMTRLPPDFCSISFEGKILPSKEKVKSLGCTLGANMSFRPLVDDTGAAAQYYLRLSSRMSALFDHNAMIIVAKAIVNGRLVGALKNLI